IYAADPGARRRCPRPNITGPRFFLPFKPRLRHSRAVPFDSRIGLKGNLQKLCARTAAILLVVSELFAGTSFGQSALDGFDPNANGSVHALAVQADGKILLGGEFTTVG